ncbi:MAG: glycosyltransferase [bacterium]|nr:glycosyltransferase [bacterium]
MRVLMLCPRFPVISETFIIEHARSLGSELVGIIATTVDQQLLCQFSDLPSVAELAPDPPQGGFWNAPRLKARWREQRRAPGGGPSWSPDVQDRLLEHIRALDPDVIFVEFGTIAAWAFPALQRSGVPFIVRFHGVDASATLENESYRESLRHVLPAAQGVLVVSQAMRHRLSELARSVHFEVNACGVDVPAVLPQCHADTLSCRLLIVGRMTGKKAPLRSLEAAVLARSQTRTPLRLEVIGSGPLDAQVEDFVSSQGLSDWVFVHGAQPHEQVFRFMRDADVFLQHSVVAENGDREGSPVAVMEAAAAAVPVVATRHEGLVDIVVDGETGFLVEEHDVEAMADRISMLASDPELRLAMGQQAWERADQHFRSERANQRIRAMLKAAVEKGRQPQGG